MMSPTARLVPNVDRSTSPCNSTTPGPLPMYRLSAVGGTAVALLVHVTAETEPASASTAIKTRARVLFIVAVSFRVRFVLSPPRPTAPAVSPSRIRLVVVHPGHDQTFGLAHRPVIHEQPLEERAE